MKIIITGASGRLGKEVHKIYPEAYAPSHNEVDITEKEDVNFMVKKIRPDILIHLAALTSIRRCEENKEQAWKVNVIGTENLVSSCETFCPRKTYFVYMSTPCIFSGKNGPYIEDSIPNPVNFYGLTKLLGEYIVKHSRLFSVIIRSNFVPYEPWPYQAAFVDRISNYLFAHDLAVAIKDVIEEKLSGIIHISGKKELSMYDLARMCPEGEKVKTITLSEYSGPHLTKDMRLESTRWKKYDVTRGI
jgi:dTDP-4-dehydrorhamnose reductase